MKYRKRKTRQKLLLIGALSICLIVGCIVTIAVVHILQKDQTPVEVAEIKENNMALHQEGSLKHHLSFIQVDVELEKRKEVPSGTKLVALTFDDGPGYASTQRILDVLEKYDAKATWFCLGSKIAQNPEMLKQIHEAGHEIESHSYSHPDLTTLSGDGIAQEIQSTNDAIFSITGKKPAYLRPPYGNYNATVETISGLSIALWSVDSRDWESRHGDAIYDMVMTYVTPGSVILFHDIYDSTADGVEKIVAELANQGYTFVTYDELMRYQGG